MLTFLFSVSILSAEPLWPQDVPIRESTDLRYNSCSVQDNSGSIFCAWIQTLNGEPCIMGQKFGASGLALWPQAQVIKAESKEKTNLKAILTQSGNYLLAWLELHENSLCKLVMQKLSPSGELLWDYSGLVIMNNLDTGIADFLMLQNAEGGAFVIVKQDGGPRLYALKLDAGGNNLWPEGYPTITAQNSISLSSVIADGEGGFFLFFKGYTQTGGTNYSERYASTGYRYWRNSFPRLTGEDTAPHQVFLTQDQKVIELAKSLDTTANLELRYFAFDGTQLYEPAIQYTFSYSATSASEYRARLVGDSLLAILSVGVTDSGLSETALHRFSLTTGQFLPKLGLVAGSVDKSNPALAVDLTANLYCQWQETEATENFTQIKAQKLNSGFQPLWQIGGVTLYSGFSVLSNPSAFFVGEGLLSLFRESGSQTEMLKKQFTSPAGNTLFPAEGSSFVSLLKGTATLLATQSLANSSCIFYYDSRDNDLKRLYYQIIDPNGGMMLTAGGISLGGYYPIAKYIASLPLPGLGIAVVYQDPQTFLQVIDYSGNLLLGGSGILISASRPTEIKLSIVGTDLYLGWLENTVNGTPGSKRLMGQRIANLQAQWQDGGKQLVDNIPYLNARINASAGSYYVWYQRFSAVNSFLPCVLKVNSNGDPETGWDPNGIQAVTGVVNSIFYDAVSAGLMGSDLVLVMGANSSFSIYAQRITPTGTFPWSSEGLQLTDQNAQSLSCRIDDSAVSLQYVYGQGTERNVRLQKLDGNGIKQFGDNGVQINSFPRLEFRNPVLGKCLNGSYIAVWAVRMRESAEEVDLLYRKISSFGELIEESEGFLCNKARLQDNPRINMLGNEAIICWMDTRAGRDENNNQLYSIYAQKLSGEGSQIVDEPIVPISDLQLFPCCPNPFVEDAELKFYSEKAERLTLAIYNLKGQKVRTLFNSEFTSGYHSINWDGRDYTGTQVASGIYFARLSTLREQKVQKFVRIRTNR